MSLTPVASKALRDAYLDLFVVAARLFEGYAQATQAQFIRQHTELVIKRERDRLFQAGVPEVWVNEVQLPVIGLLDEAARKSPVTAFADAWPSLQYPTYGHELVGRISFEHLEQLRRNPETPLEVIEIYGRCLAIGFQGEYFPHRLEDLKILTEGLKNELRRRQGPPPPLAPHLEDSANVVSAPQILRPPYIIGLAALALLFTALVLTVMLSREAGETEKLLRAAAAGQVPPPAQVEGGQ